MEAKTLRIRARENLRGNWGIAIGVAAVAALLGGMLVGSGFLPELNYSWSRNYSQYHEVSEGFRINFGSGALGFAAFILGGVLQLGYAQFLLKQHDGQEVRFNDLFSQFDRFGQGFAQCFLRGLYTALWSLLFVIPGIIKSLSYSMTPFLMAEHPNMTAGEAIARSKDLMDGHKMDLFVLHLTFLGWDILAALTLNLGNLLLNPYKNAAYAAFYRQLQAEARYTVVE